MRAKLLIFNILITFTLFRAHSQNALYFEDFNNYANGETISVNWHSITNGSDHFQVKNGMMWLEMENTGGAIEWSTKSIDITGKGLVSITLDIFETGNLEAGDYIRIYYKLDDKEAVLFETNGSNEGDFSPLILPLSNPRVVAQSHLVGDSLRIVVRAHNNKNEDYWFDNVEVRGQLAVTNNTTPISCYGRQDGAITAIPVNGTPPYHFIWSNGNTTPFINKLGAGTYYVTVTDHIRNEAYDTIVITEPVALTFKLDTINASCSSVADGKLEALPEGGTPPYTYVWSGSRKTTGVLADLSSGEKKTVTITDNNGCTASASGTVGYKYDMAVAITVKGVTSITDNDGKIYLRMTKGNAPYTYNWCNGKSGEDISDLTLGVYKVTITDDKGCTLDTHAVAGVPDAVLFTGLGGDQNWNNPGNWQHNQVPDDTMNTIIPTGGCGNATVNITANDTVDNILVLAGGKIALSGSLIVKGNFTNHGTIEPGTSKTVFAGTMPQKITGTAPIAFHDLEIQNTSDGGVILERTVEVKNKLSLVSGKVYTGTDTLKITNNAEDAISGYSHDSYVVGYLNRSIKNQATAMQSYYFPVGRVGEGEFHLATVMLQTLKGTNNITVSFSDLERYNPEQFTGVRDEVLEYSGIHEKGMWIIEPDAQPTAGFYHLKLSVVNFTSLTDNMFGIVKRPKGGDTRSWSGGYGSLSAFNGEGRRQMDGYAMKKFNLGFSEFGIGNGETGLPIELTYFKVDLTGDLVELEWSTATETNNESFTIEKSNGVKFEAIATLPGAVNSSEKLTYNFIDEAPFVGQSYYRLKQTDLDGNFTYSQVEAIFYMPDKAKPSMKVYPNPSTGNIYIHLETSSSVLQIQVMDISGRMIYNNTLDVSSGRALHNINLRNEILPGTYLVMVKDGHHEYQEKIIIK